MRDRTLKGEGGRVFTFLFLQRFTFSDGKGAREKALARKRTRGRGKTDLGYIS